MYFKKSGGNGAGKEYGFTTMQLTALGPSVLDVQYLFSSIKEKKVKLCLCLTKHSAMKACKGLDV
jgi:hypothetical protein